MGKPSLSVWEVAEKLDSGQHWSDPIVTYSFPLTDPGYVYGGFSPFSIAQQQMVEMVLALWSDVANITFVPANDDQSGQIRFFNSDELPLAGQSAFPGKEDWQGDVHLNPTDEGNLDAEGNYDTSFGGFALLTLLHEVGHALGLDHPGDYDADPENPDLELSYTEYAEYFEDSRQYTVMSYFDAEWTDAQHEIVQGVVYASAPLLHDIYAIQQIYGTNLSTREGDTVYGYNSTADRDVFDFTKNSFPVIAIWDGGGIDTLDLSGSRSAVRLDLAPGAFSDVFGLTKNVAIAHKTVVENAIGGNGNDVIVGNRSDNVLRGGDGNDELYGEQPGDYYMIGDEDADELYGEDGNDTLRGGFDGDLLHGGAGDDDLDGGVGDDELNGGAGNDFLKGDAGVDEIHGGSGDDIIYGHRWWMVKENPNDPDWLHADPDRLYGGDGNDTIFGGFGNDWIEGDGGHDDNGETNHSTPWTGIDELYGEEGSDTIKGGDGGDRIFGGDGVDYLYGGRGADTIHGDRDGDFLYGDAGDDTLSGDSGNDELDGDAGADDLYGGSGQDTLEGNDGNDWLHGGADRDFVLHGGAGTDTASYFDETDSWTVDLANGYAINEDASYDEFLVSIEKLELGSGDDTAYGTDGANEIWGGAGKDTIKGRKGNDILHGDAGVDTLRGGPGADLLDPGAGHDFVYGDDGNDTLTYAWAEQGVLVHLDESKASGEEIGTDLVLDVENAIGGAGNDQLYGDSKKNVLDGGAGNDTLAGLAGDDHLIGGGGSDRLLPGWGDDTVDGGEGVDTVDYSDSPLDWTVNLSHFASADMPLLGEFQHTLIGVENVTLGSGNDTVWGDNGSNTIIGNDGDDWLYGGDGEDTLHGGAGADTLNGGGDNDRLLGGDGNDVFVFITGSQADTVYDFEDGIDVIDLSAMTGYDSFEDLTIQENGGDALILMGADSIVLVGMSSAALDNNDFIWA